MSVKFITAIYSRLAGSDLGGRHARGGHYRYSLLSLLKMTNADFICYTTEDEKQELEVFFYVENNISKEKLKFIVFFEFICENFSFKLRVFSKIQQKTHFTISCF